MADAILAQSGIYKITNTVNGKMYVGSAVKFKDRWTLHRGMLRRGCHHSITLQRAWNKYGQEAFAFEVLEVVQIKSVLIAREQHWIDLLGVVGKNGYNICPKAGSSLGAKQSEETKKKVRAALLARTPETLARIAASRVGIKHTDETRAKRSAALKGRVFSEEHKARISARVVSDETRAKLSVIAKSRSPETNQKIGAGNRGRRQSAESIAKQIATKRANGGYEASDELRKHRSEAMKGKPKSPEHIANMSRALTGRKVSQETIAKIRATLLAKGPIVLSDEARRKIGDANRLRAEKRRQENVFS